MKETFIIRAEWWGAIQMLDTEGKAQIFENLFHFHIGNQNLINLNNLQVKLVWALIEPNLIRNADYYDRRIETSRLNGLKGGRPKKEVEKPNGNLKKPIETQAETQKPIETLSDPDPDPDPDLDSDNLLLKKEAKGDFSQNQKIQELEEANRALVEQLEAEKKRKKVAPKKEKREEVPVVMPFETEDFKSAWEAWIDFKASQFNFKYKSNMSIQAALMELSKLADGNELSAIAIIHQSIANGWRGFYELKQESCDKGNSNYNSAENRGERVRSRARKLEGSGKLFSVEI